MASQMQLPLQMAEYKEDNEYILDAERQVIAELRGCTIVIRLERGQYIIRAVNSYDAMREALVFALDGFHHWRDSAIGADIPLIDQAITEIDAALAMGNDKPRKGTV